MCRLHCRSHNTPLNGQSPALRRKGEGTTHGFRDTRAIIKHVRWLQRRRFLAGKSTLPHIFLQYLTYVHIPIAIKLSPYHDPCAGSILELSEQSELSLELGTPAWF